MTSFEILLFVHIVAVTIWFGGALVGMLIGNSLRKTGDSSVFGQFCCSFAAIAGPIFGGTALLTLLTGIGMVAMDGGPDWSDLWVSIGMGGWLIAAVFGATILGGTWTKVGKELIGGATLEATDALIKRAVNLSWIDLVFRLGLILIMVWRPT